MTGVQTCALPISGGQVLEIVGSQSMARQCLIAAIQHKPETGASASKENEL